MGGITLPIFKVGKPFAVKREFRTVSKVPSSLLFYADNYVRNTTFFENGNWLNWNSDVVWFAISFS